jgi:hypothetical protein
MAPVRDFAEGWEGGDLGRVKRIVQFGVDHLQPGAGAGCVGDQVRPGQGPDRMCRANRRAYPTAAAGTVICSTGIAWASMLSRGDLDNTTFAADADGDRIPGGDLPVHVRHDGQNRQSAFQQA